MAKNKGNIRDILIGLLLLAVGLIALLQNFNLLTINEELMPIGLAGLGGVLLLLYLVRRSQIWLFILSLCAFFLAATIYISTDPSKPDELVGVSLFLLLAFAFLFFFVGRPSQWWALLVGWICIGLAGTVYASTSPINVLGLEQLSSDARSALMLFTSIGLGFFFVWTIKPRTRWWALLTTGMIAAVEVVIYLDYTQTADPLKAVYLFVIAGISFFLVWLLRNEEHELGWAVYPALVLLTFGAFLYLAQMYQENNKLIIAFLLIGVGLIFILNYLRQAIFGASKSTGKSGGRRTFESKKPQVSDEEFWKESEQSAPTSLPPASAAEERESLLQNEEEVASEAEEVAESTDWKEESKDIRPPVDYPISSSDDDSDDDPDKK